jgi:integrase
MHLTNRLTAPACKSLNVPGYHLDGDGLHLQVSKSGGKSWVYRYTLFGRTREMGLGPYPTVSLVDARTNAADSRRLKAAGIDPLTHKRHARRVARATAAKQMSFEVAVKKFLKIKTPGWSAKYGTGFERTFELHVTPIIGRLDIAEIETPDILRVIEPLWLTKNDTAEVVRYRLESMMDWAKSASLRAGDNPARWQGHLEHLLVQVVKEKKHRAALAYRAVPAFMARLRADLNAVARALEFIILCGSRSSEVTCMTWQEIDFEARVWRIPAERMKARKEHHVPLPDEALGSQ